MRRVSVVGIETELESDGAISVFYLVNITVHVPLLSTSVLWRPGGPLSGSAVVRMTSGFFTRH